MEYPVAGNIYDHQAFLSADDKILAQNPLEIWPHLPSILTQGMLDRFGLKPPAPGPAFTSQASNLIAVPTTDDRLEEEVQEDQYGASVVSDGERSAKDESSKEPVRTKNVLCGDGLYRDVVIPSESEEQPMPVGCDLPIYEDPFTAGGFGPPAPRQGASFSMGRGKPIALPSNPASYTVPLQPFGAGRYPSSVDTTDIHDLAYGLTSKVRMPGFPRAPVPKESAMPSSDQFPGPGKVHRSTDILPTPPPEALEHQPEEECSYEELRMDDTRLEGLCLQGEVTNPPVCEQAQDRYQGLPISGEAQNHHLSSMARIDTMQEQVSMQMNAMHEQIRFLTEHVLQQSQRQLPTQTFQQQNPLVVDRSVPALTMRPGADNSLVIPGQRGRGRARGIPGVVNQIRPGFVRMPIPAPSRLPGTLQPFGINMGQTDPGNVTAESWMEVDFHNQVIRTTHEFRPVEPADLPGNQAYITEMPDTDSQQGGSTDQSGSRQQ
ncbi:MAG: hypothetical protein GY696_19630 [Gammaproteobacteria bacterium]|nr:hypothetical protein [Gammaproteobacteria bacterium]